MQPICTVKQKPNGDSDSRCGNRKSFVKSDLLTILALTADQRVLRFRECNPTQSHPIGSVYGLQAPDTMLAGMDFRVQDGQLYGVGNGGGIYTIDTNTAVATLVQNLTVSLDGHFFGVDFNPAANALRIISNTGQNLRQPFAGPLAGQTQTDAIKQPCGPARSAPDHTVMKSKFSSSACNSHSPRSLLGNRSFPD